MKTVIPILGSILLSALALIEMTTRPAQIVVSSIVFLLAAAGAAATHGLRRKMPRTAARKIEVAVFVLPMALSILSASR